MPVSPHQEDLCVRFVSKNQRSFEIHIAIMGIKGGFDSEVCLALYSWFPSSTVRVRETSKIEDEHFSNNEDQREEKSTEEMFSGRWRLSGQDWS